MVEMQLGSLHDHESRHHYRDGGDGGAPTEHTPLLTRAPAAPAAPSAPAAPAAPAGGHVTTAVVSALLFVLLAGVVIGVYLLVQQSNEENVLPPVEMALQLVSSSQWDPEGGQWDPDSGQWDPDSGQWDPEGARFVVAVHTRTRQCSTSGDCCRLLRTMQSTSPGGSLPYNFLVASSGQTFEALGWRRAPSLYPDLRRSLLVAFIGNFTSTRPARAQLAGAARLLAASVSRRHLHRDYRLLGRGSAPPPAQLYRALSGSEHWSQRLTDEDGRPPVASDTVWV